MPDVRARTGFRVELAVDQREALWKWRWLGLRGSTPAFRASLILLAAIAFALATYVVVIDIR